MENIVQGQWFGTSGADLGEPINQSLRFRNVSASNGVTYLHCAGLAGEQLGSYTVSVWLKRGDGGLNDGARYIITSGDITTGTGGGTNTASLKFNNDGATPGFAFADGGANTHTSSQPLHRDPSAWYHVVGVFDDSANTIKLYVNGVEIRSVSATSASTLFNKSGDTHVLIGLYADPDYAGAGWKGLMAEFNFLETVLAPTDFGRTNDQGIWVPKAIDFTSAQYGARGFRLQFLNSAGIGDDSAPIGTGHSSANDFTGVGFDTSAISSTNEDRDVDFEDTPTNNFTTLNPIMRRSENLTFEQAEMRVQYGSGGSISGMFTQGFTGGKYYWEVTPKVQVEMDIGLVDGDANLEEISNAWYDTANGWAWRNSATRHHNGTTTDPSHTAYGVDDTVGIYVDADAGTATIRVNNAVQSSAQFTNIPTNKRIYPFFRLGGGSGDANFECNFGQMPFVHDPGTGWNKLATNSLPEPTIKNGRDHFDILLYDGAGGSQTITGLNFKPDFVWMKYRSGSDGHILQNSLRGVHKGVQSGSNAAEFDDNTTLTSFNSDGFTVGGNAQTNNSGRDYCAWCWKAGGAPTTTNDNAAGSAQDAGSVKVDGADGSFAHGTIAVKKMSVNTTAGFSMVEYTGTGSAGSIPHGLGKVPEFAFIKRTDGTGDFDCYHVSLGNTKVIKLNSSSAKSADGTAYYNNTTPTSTVFTIGAGGANNTSGENYVAWFWAPIEGFSQFGKYTGHSNSGTNVEGHFVWTGFKPSMIMVKNIDTGGGWTRLDTTRSATGNPTKLNLSPANVAEATMDGGIDFLANGFKVRQGGGELGDASLNFVYMAWAENPMGGENCAPATAR